jgi:chromosome segregation ATPase
MTKAATVQLSQFKKNIDTLKKEIHEMYQVIMIRNEEIQKSMIPVLENSLESLRRQIDLQDKENEALEAQSEGIESEMSDVSQLCEECLDHMRHLEEEVGSYTS